jgi:hypothetical protein
MKGVHIAFEAHQLLGRVSGPTCRRRAQTGAGSRGGNFPVRDGPGPKRLSAGLWRGRRRRRTIFPRQRKRVAGRPGEEARAIFRLRQGRALPRRDRHQARLARRRRKLRLHEPRIGGRGRRVRVRASLRHRHALNELRQQRSHGHTDAPGNVVARTRCPTDVPPRRQKVDAAGPRQRASCPASWAVTPVRQHVRIAAPQNGGGRDGACQASKRGTQTACSSVAPRQKLDTTRRIRTRPIHLSPWQRPGKVKSGLNKTKDLTIGAP